MAAPPHTRLFVPLACVAALAAGSLASPEEGGGAFLVDLHVHGSLSEGYGSMTNHAQQAAASGYDGLWWTDHMIRLLDTFLPLEVPFEGSLESGLLPPPISAPAFAAVVEGEDPGLLDLEFPSGSPAEGQQHLRVDADASNVFGIGRKTARLSFRGYDRSQRQGLLTEPVIGTWVRYRGHSGEAGFLLRIRLTGTPDGDSREGSNRALEFLPGNFNTAPAPSPGTNRIVSRPLPMNQWVYAEVRLGDLIGSAPVLEEDMSIVEVSVDFWARGSGEVSVDLDAFSIGRDGPSGVDAYDAQADWLAQNPVPGLFQHVGAEIEGPLEQTILTTSSRDHLVALFPTTTPVEMPFPAGSPSAVGYPGTGVQAIQAAGGVAVLSHLFGADQDHNNTGSVIPSSTAQVLSDRVVNNAAWGADAIEIGYPRRARWLEDFVDVWDRLSADRVYVTGVAASDNHDLEPWADRRNRWGTWILAPSPSMPDLVAAVRSGRTFFGDPFRFDPDGSFELREDGFDFVAGNVVPVQSGNQKFRVVLDGGNGGDDVVILKNGVEVYRKNAGGGNANFFRNISVQPGDWVRAELRDNQENAYAFTNPVYFIGAGETPPAHRAP